MVAVKAQTGELIINGRYILRGSLGMGGVGLVQRAFDRLAGAEVALKRVAPPSPQPIPPHETLADPRVTLAQEFRTLASLRHPNIVSVLDYGFDANDRPYFTMELIEDAENLLHAGRGQSVEARIRLLIQVLQALVYLHHRNILHRDLSPRNVLVAGGAAKMIDFGLSVDRNQQTGIGGTLAYIAPEVLRGSPPSIASDLYAFGVLAYELFSGRHPFDTSSPSVLIDEILDKAPDVAALGLPAIMTAALERTLAKQPDQRPQSAADLMALCYECIGQRAPVESTTMRESFLQAARLVGREREMAYLFGALGEAMAGRGSAWLIGGESGVGKSRLIDELRINALVRGVHALRGHATSNGGDIRECWSDMARWLCLLAEPDSYEVSVLKLLVPDIDALVEYPVPVVPDLDAQTSRERLAAVLEALFQRQKTPLLLILEDLQWFRGDALALVARICRAAEHAPLFIVGSYRDDEAPDMPHRLPGMRPLHLDRLSPPHIAEMSELMLGAAGRGSQLIDLLQRETEGNAFFIVEVVRALAEEAGELAQIGRLTLPSSVFAGGMRQVINRRLGRVPESARPLLQIAAVAGRYLDLHLLQAIAGPDFDLQGWLGACADAAVLDVHPGGWRFSHDKLREGLLEALTPAARRARHRTVAEGIERVYPDRVAYVTTLAYHWTQAGDLAKEARYKAQAGKLAVENFAFSEAIPLLARALELAPQVGLDAAEQAALESQLGIAEPVFELSIGHFQRALVLLRQPIPPPRTNWRSAAEFVRQVAVHRGLPSRLIRARRARRARLLQAAQTYQELSGRYWAARKIQPGAFAALRALNLAERAGPSATLARAYAGACIGASGVLALHRLARRYAHLARRVADAADEPGTLAYVLNAVSLPAIFDARWLDARADLMPSVQLGRELHDAAAFLGATANLMTVCYYQGHFAEGLSYAERALGDLGQAVTGATDYANVRLNQARHLIALRRLDEAIAVLGNLSTLVDQGDGGRAALQREALLCLAYCRKGDRTRAGDALSAAARLRDHTGASKKLLAEAAVEMWWAAGADSPPTTRALASEAVAALGSVARVRACERPGFYRLLGAAAWLESARGDADEAWRLAIREAQRLEMPYEEAQSIDLLCRHARLSPRERTHFTDRASALKSQLFAAQD